MSRKSEIQSATFEKHSDASLQQELADALAKSPIYKSADIPTAQEVKIPPGDTRSILFAIDPDTVPKVKNLEALDGLQVTVKSKWARAGATMGDIEGKVSHGYTRPGGYIYDSSRNGNLTRLQVTNLTLRTLHIPENTPFFRYYSLNEANRVIGDDLKKLIDQKDQLLLSGDRWRQLEDSIYLPIDPSSQKALEPGFNREFSVKKSLRHRNDVDDQLLPLNPFMLPQLVLGRTDHVKIGRGLEGKLHRTTALGHTHANSLLMDGDGVTNDEIRTEVRKVVTPAQLQDGVFLSIYKH